MKPSDLIRESLRALAHNRGRTALTALGVVIGIAAVIAMTALVTGVRTATFERLGLEQARAVSLTYVGADAMGLSEGDVTALRNSVPGFEVLAGSISTTAAASTESKSIADMGVMGVKPEWFKAASAQLAAGRLLNENDNESSSRAILLTDSLMRQLYGADANPATAVGQHVTIAGTPFTVAGVLEDRGVAAGLVSALMPLSTLRQRVGAPEGGLYTSVLSLAREGEDVDALSKQAKQVIESRKDNGSGSVSVWPMKAAKEQSDAVMESFQLLLTCVAGVSLVVGGIGIMNMMLTSVTERTREIGLRRALGARRSDILAQFLIEAVAVCLVGGVVGMASGYAGAWAFAGVAAGMTDVGTVTPEIPTQVTLGAAGVSAVIGIVFGLYPAWRAAHLSPIEALRHS